MKTLLFTLEYPPFKGGVANYYEHLVKYYPDPKKILVLHNNENKLIKQHAFPKWMPAYRALKKMVKQEGIEHIIVGHILPLGTVTYFFSMFNKINYTVMLHGMDFAYAMKKTRKKILAKMILSNSKNIICANRYTKNLIVDIFSNIEEEKITVVNPGVDSPPAINKSEIDRISSFHNLGNKKILFSLGRLVKRKGFDKVIEAMPEILKYIPNLCYYIAGTGNDEEYLRNLAKQYKNINFLGNIREKEKWVWLNICNVFAMPARSIDGDFEGFGIVFLEANIVGKPVIAGNSGGQTDAVKNTLSGFLVDPENTEQIANAIIKLMTEEQNAKLMGEYGRARAQKEFQWQTKIDKIYNLLNTNV